MKSIINDLESCIKNLENINNILKKSNNFNNKYIESELYKKIEDGILDSIHNANTHQLSLIMNGGYKFKFYHELNNKELLRAEIQKRIRNNRLNKLLNE